MASLLPALLSSLDYLSYYGVDIPLQLGWLTLPTVGSTPSARNASYGDADAFFEGSNVSSLLQMPAAGLYERRVSGRPGSYSRLLPGWEQNLSSWVDTQLAPRLANRTAAGVFVGDEICCHNATCVSTLLTPLTSALRDRAGEAALIYANECGDTVSALPKQAGALPPALDLFGFDEYRYGPSHRAGDETAAVRKYAEQELFPRLGAHQRFMAVPGTFACTNASYSPAAVEDVRIAGELRAYAAWARSEPRVAGLKPWHFRTRDHPQHAGPCDMEIGAASLPKTMAVLRALGREVRAGRVG